MLSYTFHKVGVNNYNRLNCHRLVSVNSHSVIHMYYVYVHVIFVTQARVLCLICTYPQAQWRVQTYQARHECLYYNWCYAFGTPKNLPKLTSLHSVPYRNGYSLWCGILYFNGVMMFILHSIRQNFRVGKL